MDMFDNDLNDYLYNKFAPYINLYFPDKNNYISEAINSVTDEIKKENLDKFNIIEALDKLTYQRKKIKYNYSKSIIDNGCIDNTAKLIIRNEYINTKDKTSFLNKYNIVADSKNILDSLIDSLLNEIYSWRKDSESLLIDFRFFGENKTSTFIDKYIKSDIKFIIYNSFKNYNSDNMKNMNIDFFFLRQIKTSSKRRKVTQTNKDEDQVEKIVFAENNLKSISIINSSINDKKEYLKDKNLKDSTKDLIANTMFTLSDSKKQLLSSLYQLGGVPILTNERVTFPLSLLVKLLKNNDSGQSYEDVKADLYELSHIKIDRVTSSGSLLSANILTDTDIINVEDLSNKDDFKNEKYIVKTGFGPTLRSALVKGGVSMINDEKVRSIKNPIAQTLIHVFQTERLKFYFENIEKKDYPNTFTHTFLFEQLSSEIYFGKLKPSKIIKKLEAAFESMKSENFLIHDFDRIKNSLDFSIELFSISNEEYNKLNYNNISDIKEDFLISYKEFIE